MTDRRPIRGDAIMVPIWRRIPGGLRRLYVACDIEEVGSGMVHYEMPTEEDTVLRLSANQFSVRAIEGHPHFEGETDFYGRVCWVVQAESPPQEIEVGGWMVRTLWGDHE